MRIVTLLVGLPLVATRVNALVMGGGHFCLSRWPAHACHHLARQIILDCGLSWLGLVRIRRFLVVGADLWLWLVLRCSAAIGFRALLWDSASRVHSLAERGPPMAPAT